MPKRGIKKRILNKVGSLFSIRGAKHRLEINGDQKELDSNSPKAPDINTMHGVLSTLTPQKKPRGIRFSRRAVQRSKYLRQKFGVRKTVMGFSPRVGSITEEDESEINLWMLAENAENVISEGMAWLRNSEDCFDDSSGNQEEVDEEKILQMWIESNSFNKIYDDKDDKNIYREDDYDSSSFSGDDDDDSHEPVKETSDDNDDDDDDDEHQHPISNDHDSTSDEDIDDDDENINVTQNNQDNINNSYPSNDTGTDSVDDDEGNDDGDDTVDNDEIIGDSVNEKCCSIYVDDESFDELDDDDGDISHKQLESSGTDNDDGDDGDISHKQLIYSGTDNNDDDGGDGDISHKQLKSSGTDNNDGDGDISHKKLEFSGTDNDDDGDISHKQLKSFGTDDYDEIRTNRSEDNPKHDFYNFSNTGSNKMNIKHTLSDPTNFPSTTDIKNIGYIDEGKGFNPAKENTPKFDSTSSEIYKHYFVNAKDMSNVSICNETGSEKIFLRFDGDDNNQAECKLSHENEDSTGEREATVIVHALESRYDNDDYYYDGDDNNVDINCNHGTASFNARTIFNDDLKNNTVKAPQDLDVTILNEETLLPEKPLDREINAKECKKIGEIQITPDDAVIGAVKEEIDDILSRISQIESDFNFMRTTMNEFRSSAVQNNDKMQ